MFVHWILKSIGLVAVSFLHEDVAILTAAFFVTHYHMPWFLALVSLYIGIVVGDLLLYGLGASARWLPWARRLLIKPSVEKLRRALERHLVPSVAFCRVLPGVLFPTFVACGWFGLSFTRFALTTMATAAAYTPVMLWLVITCRLTVLKSSGYRGWVLMLAVVLALTILGSRGAKSAVLRRLANGRPTFRRLPLFRRAKRTPQRTHQGMPPLNRLQRWIHGSERMPPVLFYAPYAAHWLLLGLRYQSFTLPTAVNPAIEAGGLWGESKSRCMNLTSNDQPRWLAPFITVTKGRGRAPADTELDRALAGMAAAGLGFPIVAKPDIGWQGYGVRLLPDADELRRYLEAFPDGETLLLQRYVPYDGEAGVFYVRYPGERAGRVTGLCLRYFPYVIGDGNASVRQLIERHPRMRSKADLYLGAGRWHLGQGVQDADAVPEAGEVVRLSFIGSIRVGGLYRDAASYISPLMSERFDAIARSIPEFHVGRFDIRFDSMERLQAGDGFLVIEINGAGAETIHIWDPEKPLLQTYRALLDVQSMLFRIGAQNRSRGFRPITIRQLAGFAWRQHKLILRYPPSG